MRLAEIQNIWNAVHSYSDICGDLVSQNDLKAEEAVASAALIETNTQDTVVKTQSSAQNSATSSEAPVCFMTRQGLPHHWKNPDWSWPRFLAAFKSALNDADFEIKPRQKGVVFDFDQTMVDSEFPIHVMNSQTGKLLTYDEIEQVEGPKGEVADVVHYLHAPWFDAWLEKHPQYQMDYSSLGDEEAHKHVEMNATNLRWAQSLSQDGTSEPSLLCVTARSQKESQKIIRGVMNRHESAFDLTLAVNQKALVERLGTQNLSSSQKKAVYLAALVKLCGYQELVFIDDQSANLRDVGVLLSELFPKLKLTLIRTKKAADGERTNFIYGTWQGARWQNMYLAKKLDRVHTPSDTSGAA